ncbi:hypothetical protein P152DRAFT_316985 [Eremomyces bilateralis CBS 781.70]|uniref:Zn(2)-C6 fungal-type domain-containing protein n=1 Tax=Eremomyces bilateralis CBS 781.70 TaxID=1392243 RepID=A0A6G1G606_9PEZI|nr:uncharacterized protein P152DRAFT_316985 [Eremomyces bilateralis CBS 781.70]KAF1813381.1 hypothetical protein P152DRAFT_316985 [Eremomyces bilateralis CBS 781.70]
MVGESRDAMDPPKEEKLVIRKRTRATGPRVKTGCLTCKSRHLKCDERRPTCFRCERGGLNCAGYGYSLTPKSILGSSSPYSVTHIPSPLRDHEALLPKESRAIEYFHVKVAPHLAGHFHQRFWTEGVLQMSARHVAVRHALISLSTMFETDLLRHSLQDVPKEKEQYALETFNAAIRDLLTMLHDPTTVYVPLAVCIIFVCLDSMRMNSKAVVKHVEGGIMLLNMWFRHQQRRLPLQPSLTASDKTLMEEVLIPIFTWLGMMATTFGRPGLVLDPGLTQPISDGPAPAMESLEQAISVFMRDVTEVFGFSAAMAEMKFQSTVDDKIIAQHERLQGAVHNWKVDFDRMVSKKWSTWTPSSMLSIGMVNAIHLSIRYWLEGCAAPTESIWDDYKSVYEEILGLVEDVVQSTRMVPEHRVRSFHFEMGYIPPLQFVLWRCRYPQIRRKALRILRDLPRQECLFDSKQIAVLYAQVISLEEESLGIPLGETPSDDQLPPESSRIHRIDFPPLPPTSRGRPVNFLSRPNGLDGGWHVRSQYLGLKEMEFLRWFDMKSGTI